MTALPYTTALSIGLLLLLSGAQTAASQTRVVLADESRLWIEGTSSVNAFTCTAGEVEGVGVLYPWQPSDDRTAEAEVEVPVRRFDCGKDRMNNDFYGALRAEAHDLIRFRLDETTWIAPAAGAEAHRLHVAGRLQIAGTERKVAAVVQGRQRPDGSYGVAGSLPLLMSDFGIDPPTALFGLIKAHDKITVHFDLIGTTQPISYTTEK